MVWGLPWALSVMVMLANSIPAALGVNVTVRVQLAPVAREASQVGVRAKSPLLAPPRAMPLIVRAAVPVLVKVTVWGPLVVLTPWPANVRPVAERVAIGTAVPTPPRTMVWGLLAALSVRVTAP